MINVTVKTLDSQNHSFSVEDDVSFNLIHAHAVSIESLTSFF
jgi:hypothetical protein